MDFKLPPYRMNDCEDTLDEYKKCEKLDVFAVDCQGEGKTYDEWERVQKKPMTTG